MFLCEAYEVGWDLLLPRNNNNNNQNLTKIMQLRTLAKAFLLYVFFINIIDYCLNQFFPWKGSLK